MGDLVIGALKVEESFINNHVINDELRPLTPTKIPF